jgi:hypothetical protein
MTQPAAITPNYTTTEAAAAAAEAANMLSVSQCAVNSILHSYLQRIDSIQSQSQRLSASLHSLASQHFCKQL